MLAFMGVEYTHFAYTSKDFLRFYVAAANPSFPHCHYLEIPKSADQTHFPLFKSGVLFSSFHPKGDVLVAFLESLQLHPNKVIFVDDEMEHVHSVVTSLDKQGIACLGIHYTAANETSCELNSEHARFQVNHFIEHDIWLSDAEAKELSQSKQ